jgi:predicted ATPase
VGSEDTYCFRHEAFRTVLTRGLPERWKRSVHLKIAALLESKARESCRVPALEILTHYQAARDVSKVLEYLPVAGDELAAGQSLRAALDCYNSYLELWALLDRESRKPYWATTARVMRETARILELLGLYDKALGMLQSLVRLSRERGLSPCGTVERIDPTTQIRETH